MNEIKLVSGKATATCTCAGAEMLSYIPANGREYIWKGDPDIWPRSTPMLFPACSATKDNQALFDGVVYPLGKHGFTRLAPFTIGKHGQDFVELIYRSNEQTRAQYPYEFVLHVTHTISEEGFSTTFLVENPGEVNMPFCIGGHPGFSCPIYPGERFEDYQLQFERPERLETLTLSDGTCIDGKELLPQSGTDTLPLVHDLFDNRDALIFDQPASRVVKVINPATGKGFAFDFHKFDVLAVWTMPKKKGDYLCLEPWCGLPALKEESGEFAEKRHVKWLAPGESFKIGFGMTVID